MFGGCGVRVGRTLRAGAITVAVAIAGCVGTWTLVASARAGEMAATGLSPECAAKSPAHEGRRAFRRVHQALLDRRAARVLAIGSSSTVGVGASKPAATFTEQLEADLERAFKGADFDIIGRGMSGEVAEATAARLRAEALQFKPDLIVWQVGTNDGVARVDPAVFAALLTTTLRWLPSYRFDVVLIDPQYVTKFSSDEHYKAIVRLITDIARRERVPLVHRYDAMEDLARRQINRSYMAGDHVPLERSRLQVHGRVCRPGDRSGCQGCGGRGDAWRLLTFLPGLGRPWSDGFGQMILAR